ncbi:MAG TPA: hypothetical protein VGD49_04630 [Longimicrobiales bacterium]
MPRLVIALFMSVIPAVAVAQDVATVPQIEAGARVRIWTETLETPPLKARVQTAGSQNIAVTTNAGSPPRILDVNAMQRIDVSRGRNRLVWSAAGMLLGATAGVLISRADGDEGDMIGGIDETAEGIGNTITGALVGGVVGFLVAPERWRTSWQK